MSNKAVLVIDNSSGNDAKFLTKANPPLDLPEIVNGVLVFDNSFAWLTAEQIYLQNQQSGAITKRFITAIDQWIETQA